MEWRNRIVESGTAEAGTLMPNPRNWRRHPAVQQAALSKGLQGVGWVQSVVVNRRTGRLLDGHLRVALALEQGTGTAVPVNWVELTEEEETAVLVTLDPIAGMATTDEETLLANVRSLDGTDFAAMVADVASILGVDGTGAAVADPGPQVDKAGELQAKWGTATGQLWQLGEHRLICGDCTDAAVVARVMGGERAQMAVTSPPYGVGKSYETKGIGPWFETIRPCIKLLCEHCQVVVWQLGDLYSTGSQHIEPTMAYSLNMFAENGMKPIWIRIWEKQGMNFGVGPYHLVSNKPVQQYEYIAAVGSDDDGVETTEFEWLLAFGGPRHKFVRRLNKYDRKAWGYAGVWKINTVAANDNHPAMFPLELPERCIKMHSDEGDIVMEPFSGSGTTLIACERLGRRCRACEIEPGYVGVALERFYQMTGIEPVLLEAA